MIKYKIRGSDWLKFPLIIVNFNHFFIQPAPEVQKSSLPILRLDYYLVKHRPNLILPSRSLASESLLQSGRGQEQKWVIEGSYSTSALRLVGLTLISGCLTSKKNTSFAASHVNPKVLVFCDFSL